MNKSQYKSLKEWKKACPKDYLSAQKQGLLAQICEYFGWEYKPRIKWTKERCREEALKYDVKEEWKKAHTNSHAAALRNGWYMELTTHMKPGCTPKGYWTKERCREEALNFDMKERWKKEHPKSYQAARRNGWVDELASHMAFKGKNNGYWTKERCIEHAKNFNTITEWTNDNTTPVINARKYGWMDECTTHMVRNQQSNGYWQIKENVLESARECKTRREWSNKYSRATVMAKKYGWYEEATRHMKLSRKLPGHWDIKENVLAEARKYNSRSEWSKKSITSYRKGKKNGWYEEAVAHMKKK